MKTIGATIHQLKWSIMPSNINYVPQFCTAVASAASAVSVASNPRLVAKWVTISDRPEGMSRLNPSMESDTSPKIKDRVLSYIWPTSAQENK